MDRCRTPDYACNLLVQPGSSCFCDSATGIDTCTKYSECKKTPCKVCSDCLADFNNFTRAQEFNQDVNSVKAAFATFCTKAGFTSDTCTAVTSDTRSTLNGMKRAGLLCNLLQQCATSYADCELKPLPKVDGNIITYYNVSDGVVNLCTVEGTSAGHDLAGTSSTGRPPKTCEADADCDVATEVCNKAAPKTFKKCTPSIGADTDSQLGVCTKTPKAACKQCLDDFRDWAPAAGHTVNYLADEFATNCTTLNRSSAACQRAAQGFASSFRFNQAFRVGAICMHLGECQPASLVNDTITLASGSSGAFSRCTRTGVTSGGAVTNLGFAYPSAQTPDIADLTGTVCR